jgi:hypothetical protein
MAEHCLLRGDRQVAHRRQLVVPPDRIATSDDAAEDASVARQTDFAAISRYVIITIYDTNSILVKNGR